MISPKASACHCMMCEHNKGSSWLISGLIEAFWLIYLVDHLSGCHLSVLTLKPIWFFYFLTSSFYYTQLYQMSIQIKCPNINRCLLRSLRIRRILILEELDWGWQEEQNFASFLQDFSQYVGLLRFRTTRHGKIFIMWWQ